MAIDDNDKKIINDMIVDKMRLAIRTDSLSDIYQLWGSYANAQHTLLSAYIMTHAFTFLAVITAFLKFHEIQESNNLTNMPILLLTFGVCLVGLLLSIQMYYAWHRSRTIVLLIEATGKKLEDKATNNIQFFTNKSNVFDGGLFKKYKKKQGGELKIYGMPYEFDSDNTLKQMNCNSCSVISDKPNFQVPLQIKNIKKPFALRAKLFPWLFGCFYMAVMINLIWAAWPILFGVLKAISTCSVPTP